MITGNAKATVLYTEDLPPFNYLDDGELTGIGVEVINLMRKQDQNLNAIIRVRPWNRAFHLGKTEPNAGVFSLARTEKREKDFHWIGPLFSIRSFLWAKGENPITIGDLSSVQDLAVTVQKGSSGEQELIDDGFKDIEGVKDTDRMYTLLLNNRVDLMKAPDLMVRRYLTEHDHPLDTIRPVWPAGQRNLYIGFSKDTHKAIVDRWKAALEQAKMQAEYKVILSKYGTTRME